MPESGGLRGTLVSGLRYLFLKLPLSRQTKARLKELYRQYFRAGLGTGQQSNVSNGGFSAPAPATLDGNRNNSGAINELFYPASAPEKGGGYRIPAVRPEDSILAAPHQHLFYSYEEFVAEQENRSQVRGVRLDAEKALLKGENVDFKVDGFCSVCCGFRQFSVDYLYAFEKDNHGRLLPNWRESLVCGSCKMNNRVRAAVDLIRNQLKIYGQDQFYATEQLTPFYLWLKQNYQNVIGSEFLEGEHRPGSQQDGIRHEDITALSFDSESLDLILSFDVLEHVPDTRKSLSEFMRCLKPGGFALISAPFASSSAETIVRARVNEDGSIEHILPAEYHGNPTNPEAGSLCYYYFGWDLLDGLREAGAREAAVLSYYSWERANIGNEQLYFLARK